MEMDRCWELIESVRAGVDTSWEELDDVLGAALTARLAELPPDEIVAFELRFSELQDQVSADRTLTAACLIFNGCGDDSFTDFCAGMVGLGRSWHERVVADPDNLADHPLVRGIVDGLVDHHALLMEFFQASAYRAYKQVTGDDDFWDAVEEADEREDPSSDDPAGPSSSDLRLPRLAALFPESREYIVGQ
ncbi:DUF4240 domain-containing protein [Plantactinospora endophytica]|uniref:DUF4240 domain-containing protein n=1 Tax=Plantactinospora endophytica TaxID=673535 RepID=A0ABQ4E477_9ACTN|nr:DUF4240 domain-containing protein [Plantactinospora endophytica]GIG89508.1 hypothetical protein Pen02_44440 [Plantactinospora endophytica]